MAIATDSSLCLTCHACLLVTLATTTRAEDFEITHEQLEQHKLHFAS